MTAPRADTLAVVLAGGLARRMGGGDKPLRETRMGIPIRTVLMTISEVSRPVV